MVEASQCVQHGLSDEVCLERVLEGIEARQYPHSLHHWYECCMPEMPQILTPRSHTKHSEVIC